MSQGTPEPTPGIVLYQSPDGGPALSVRLQGQTAWLTQAQMAELFQTTPQNITMHIANVYTDGELPEGATCKEYLQVRADAFLTFNERNILRNAGKVSAKMAEEHAGREFAKFDAARWHGRPRSRPATLTRSWSGPRGSSRAIRASPPGSGRRGASRP